MGEVGVSVEAMDQEGVAMIAVTSTVLKGGEGKYFVSSAARGPLETVVYTNIPNIGMVAGFQRLYEGAATLDEDIVVLMHDDLEILEDGWADRIRSAMGEHTAIVGFGGAMGLGVEDIYKVPYRLEQLQRIDYYSNQIGWEIHGKQETGEREVAVVDGFLMAVRVEFLNQIGGWKRFPHNFHMYDIWLCLMARQLGWKVKMVGVECDHHGGGTSTSAEYLDYCREHGTTPEREHLEPHVTVYNEFRDLLPLRIG